MKIKVLSLLCILSISFCFSQEQEEDLVFDYYDENFKPFEKGKWFTSLSFNLRDENSSNDNRLVPFDLLIEGSEFEYEINLKGGYFFSKRQMLGIGFSRGKETEDIRGVIVSDTIRLKAETYKTGISPFLRTYYSLSKNNRLSFFNEVRIDFGFGNSDEYTIENGENTEEFESDTFVFGIGISPGINFFALENFALEVQLDVLGYEYKREKTTESSGEVASTDSHNVNFTLNLLSLNLGLAYYFGAK